MIRLRPPPPEVWIIAAIWIAGLALAAWHAWHHFNPET